MESRSQYIDHVYGLTEAGGTSVMFLSNVPFEELGLPTNVPREPIPELSWRVLSQIPKYTVAAGVVLFGVHWITARRTDVARFEAEERKRKPELTTPRLTLKGKRDEITRKYQTDFWKVVAALLMLAGLVAAVERYSLGLGATTHLVDTFPWGIWIGSRYSRRRGHRRRRIHDRRDGLYLQPRTVPPDPAADHPHGLPRLRAGDLRASWQTSDVPGPSGTP